MNCSQAYVSPRPVGFWAMVRLPKDAKARPIMEEGKPKRFNDAYSAQKAATDRVLEFFNGNLRRDGEVLLSAKARANQLFHAGAAE